MATFKDLSLNLVASPSQTKAAFQDWLKDLKQAGNAEDVSWQIDGSEVWFRHLRSASALIRTEFWVGDAEAASVQINEPSAPASEDPLSAVALDHYGARYLLRQGVLHENGASPRIRADSFSHLTGLTEVTVNLPVGTSKRHWFIVAPLDRGAENAREATVEFVSRCWNARIGCSPRPRAGTPKPDLPGQYPAGKAVKGLPRIFASSVWGMDLDKWGAWGFTDKGTRDRLAGLMQPGDFVLSIGTMGPETDKGEQGRLLALMHIGTDPIETRSMVEPAFYEEHVRRTGKEPWPFGFPIKSAEAFEPKPLRSEILPRIAKDNLHRVLGRYFVELTPQEVELVLGLPKRMVSDIYSTPLAAFSARLRSGPTGPAPSLKMRTLSPQSGPAATYLMHLSGSACQHITSRIAAPDQLVFKVGYSNDPNRRRNELNAYLPCEESLCWTRDREQWHDDEINAYAMEQEIFRLVLNEPQANRIKGEIIVANRETIDRIWATALSTSSRPVSPPTVEL